MGAALPPALRAALDSETDALPARALADSATRLSNAYRAAGTSAQIRQAADVAAYAAARLPATFAAAAVALGELARALDGQPLATLLDVGCGPGSATFAALERFPGIRTATLLDHNRALLDAAVRLSGEAGYAGARRIEPRLADALAAPLPRADLVTAAYALVEMDEPAAATLAQRLFAACDVALVLVEPGSRAGFARIRQARAALIAAGASIAAPCTHASACPIVDPDWCHFSVRLARSRTHRQAKAAVVPFEDEKFSYLVALKGQAGAPAGARIIAPPRRSKAGVDLRCCAADGIKDRRILAREARFRDFRGLDWGDRTPAF